MSEITNISAASRLTSKCRVSVETQGIQDTSSIVPGDLQLEMEKLNQALALAQDIQLKLQAALQTLDN